MSVLAMILSIAMAVPGDVPEKESAEIEKEQVLDLRGEWEGTLRSELGEVCGVRIDSQWMFFDSDKITIGWHISDFVDEGKGNLRFIGRLGRYRQEKDRLFICIGDAKGRPLDIGKQYGDLYILRRVRPSEHSRK